MRVKVNQSQKPAKSQKSVQNIYYYCHHYYFYFLVCQKVKNPSRKEHKWWAHKYFKLKNKEKKGWCIQNLAKSSHQLNEKNIRKSD